MIKRGGEIFRLLPEDCELDLSVKDLCNRKRARGEVEVVESSKTKVFRLNLDRLTPEQINGKCIDQIMEEFEHVEGVITPIEEEDEEAYYFLVPLDNNTLGTEVLETLSKNQNE